MVEELDNAWEKKIEEISKTDPIKAYEECHRELCNRCERKECERDCAFIRRVVRHIIVREMGK